MKKIGYALSTLVVCLLCSLFLNTVTVEAFHYELGDVNRDGPADAKDALLVLRYVVGMEEFDEYQRFVADVNKDGQIDTNDALDILKVTVHLSPFTVNVRMTEGESYTFDKIYDAGSYWWIYEVTPEAGLSVKMEYMDLPEGSNPGDTAEQVYTVTAEQAGSYRLDLMLRHLGRPTEDMADEIVFLFDVEEKAENTISVDLREGEEYVFDKIYDAGAYSWKYEADDASGISVTRIERELPPDSNPGDEPEQVYTVKALKKGTYKLTLTLVHAAGTPVEEKRVYIFHVK